MMLLTKQEILAAVDIKSTDVPVPEWGGTVRVRTMTGLERDAMGTAMIGADGKADMSTYRVRLVAACIVDDQGNQVFTAEDVTALGAKSAAALDRVFTAADALNQMGQAAVEQAAGN